MIAERKGTGHEIVPQEIGAIVATNVDKKDICKLNVPIRIARVVDLATEELVTKNLAQTLNLNQLVNKAPKPQTQIINNNRQIKVMLHLKTHSFNLLMVSNNILNYLPCLNKYLSLAPKKKKRMNSL